MKDTPQIKINLNTGDIVKAIDNQTSNNTREIIIQNSKDNPIRVNAGTDYVGISIAIIALAVSLWVAIRERLLRKNDALYPHRINMYSDIMKIIDAFILESIGVDGSISDVNKAFERFKELSKIRSNFEEIKIQSNLIFPNIKEQIDVISEKMLALWKSDLHLIPKIEEINALPETEKNTHNSQMIKNHETQREEIQKAKEKLMEIFPKKLGQ
jgi:hypothetical protein